MAIVKKQKDTPMSLTKHGFYLGDDNVIYYRDIDKICRLCLPECFEIELFEMAYNKNALLCINKTYLRISETLYFNKLYTHLKDFINSCHNC